MLLFERRFFLFLPPLGTLYKTHWVSDSLKDCRVRWFVHILHSRRFAFGNFGCKQYYSWFKAFVNRGALTIQLLTYLILFSSHNYLKSTLFIFQRERREARVTLSQPLDEHTAHGLDVSTSIVLKYVFTDT